MIVFYGLEEEDAAERAAKLKALAGYFNESDGPRPITMLKDGELAADKRKSSSKEKLIVSAHGNVWNIGYAGNGPQALYKLLTDKGLTNERFEAIYLMACNVGLQRQDNSVLENFATEFKRLVTINPPTAGIKVYAPRGFLSYAIVEKQVSGQTVIVVTEISVQTEPAERSYPLKEGLLLVQ
jgi:hypothetical protein